MPTFAGRCTVRFRDICHQDRAIGLLRRRLASGRVPHALLFEGPEGVGKERTALALAARLMCQAESLASEADACGACPSCVLFSRCGHPDFLVVERSLFRQHPDPRVRRTRGLFLTVDLVRHFVIDSAGLAPSLGRRRVFVIRDAERMNDAAQNALLKTLEEPPPLTALILITSAPDRLLATIRSRCQRVAFGWLPAGFVAERLRADRCEPAEAALLAELAQGSLSVAQRWRQLGLLARVPDVAETLARGAEADPESFGKQMVAAAEEITKSARRAASESEEEDVESDEESREEPAEESGGASRSKSRSGASDEQRQALKLMLLLVASVLRAALLRRTGTAGALGDFPAGPAVAGLAARLDADRLSDGIRAVAEAERMIDRNVSGQLACERLAVALGGDVLVDG